ncbi:MAG: radical SAM protein [Desulfonatronovibrio sp. MSAO_Bac4]|nr:MAG: radical SAM protein [Desulfonatronovibrio sp. MSAO_Bac4]
MNILNKYLSKGYPQLDWIQVGVTSRCNAACTYCPHWSLRKTWKGRDMPMEVFQSLAPAFSRTELVYLQGWGEPLLHPDFFTMLDLVKNKGSKAGLTSNATLLTDENIKRLVGQGLDILSLSMAGIDDSNDRIRKGTSWKKVLTAIETVHKIRISMGRNRPHIHLAYMLLGSNLDDIEKLPEFLNALGLDQIVISGLTLALDPAMEQEMYLAKSKQEFALLKSRLQSMKNELDEPGNTFFHIYNPYLSGKTCSENIQKSTYASVDGLIRPCVYTDFPEDACLNRHISSGRYPFSGLNFGSIKDQSMAEIWKSEDYSAFRHGFFNPKINKPCVHCAKRFIDDLSE